MTVYPVEVLDPDADDGTMPQNIADLGQAVVGHRIVKAEQEEMHEPAWRSDPSLVLTLDNETKVRLVDTSDCCAYTELEEFFAHPEMVDHVVTGVGATEGYTKWHIYADFGDVMRLKVQWSCGNPFYYGYGFDIQVEPVIDPLPLLEQTVAIRRADGTMETTTAVSTDGGSTWQYDPTFSLRRGDTFSFTHTITTGPV